MTRLALCLSLIMMLGAAVPCEASDEEETWVPPTWDLVIKAISLSEKYSRIRIAEQEDLDPLSHDPESGLFEFAVKRTGSTPTRDPETRRLVLADDFAIVLVLIPGGTFWMGAQKT